MHSETKNYELSLKALNSLHLWHRSTKPGVNYSLKASSSTPVRSFPQQQVKQTGNECV